MKIKDYKNIMKIFFKNKQNYSFSLLMNPFLPL